MSKIKSSARGLGIRVLAILVLAIAAWVLLKLLIGVVTAVAWTVAVVLAIVAIIWAIRVL
jgi:hypothetical protein